MHADLSPVLTKAAIEEECPFVRAAETAEELPEHARWALTDDNEILPALVFEWRSLDGEVVEQVRPLKPVVKKDGTASKYLWPAGQPPILSILERNEDAETVVIVEGTKQHLTALRYAQKDWQVAGIGGCSSWTTDGVADPALARLVPGKDVVIIFDADWQLKHQVWDAAKALGESCTSFGATSVRWGVVPGRGTTGLDDMLGSLPEDVRSDVFKRVVENALNKVGRRPRVGKEAGEMPFWDDKSPRVEKIADDLLATGSWALDKSYAVCAYEHGVFDRHTKAVINEVVDRLGDKFKRSYVGDVEAVLVKKLMDGGQLLPDVADSELVNFANTMLDLNTLTPYEHHPKYLSSQQFLVPYDPAATCPTYDDWIRAMTDDVDDLEETVSLMLDPTKTPTKAAFLYGPSRSGKSTFLRLLIAMVGKLQISGVTLEQLSNNRFASADLYGKILNVAADLSAQHLADTSTFKMITGEDVIRAERKYQQGFTFTNTALLAFSANTPPAVSEASNAYLERMKPFRFPHSFAGAEDPSIEAAMMTELSGILNRLLVAHRRFTDRGRYATTNADVFADFAQHADRVRAWVASECRVVYSPNGTKAKILHAQYSRWAEANNYGKLGYGVFTDKLKSIGIEQYSVHGTSAAHFRLEVHEGGGSGPLPVITMTEPPAARPESPESSFSTTPSSHMSEHSLDDDVRRESDRGEKGRAENDDFDDRVVAVDFETPDADQLYAGHHDGPFLRLMVTDDGTGPQTTTDPDEMRRVLLEAPRLTTHSGWRFDLPAAAFHLGLDVEELIAKSDDLFVASRLSRPPREARGQRPLDLYGLDDLAAAHLGEQKTTGLAQLKRKHKGYDKIPVDHPDYVDYAHQDGRLTRALHDVAAPHFDGDYYRRERKIATIAAKMSARGLAVDTYLLAARIAEQDERTARIRARLVEIGFPDSASPGTTKLGKARIEELADGIDLPRTPSGEVKTARETLLELPVPEGHPLAEPISLLVELGSERPFAGQVAANLRDGRIHPVYSITGVNGRWSSADPNIMGVGKRNATLLLDRDLIVAAPGHVFVQADLKGIDNRSVAGLSGDAAYAALLAPGVEINAELAKMFYGEDVDYKSVKAKIKAIGHGINFGRGFKAIAADNSLDLSETAAIWRRYFEEFPQLAEWQQHMRRMAEAGSPLPNGFGREVRCYPRNEHTQAPALPTASCTRDLAMEGLLRLGCEVPAMFIHDEVILEVPEDDAEAASERLVKAMSFDWESPSGLTIPVIAEPSATFGPRWSDIYKED